MSPECPSLKCMQMQIIWSFEYGTQWSIVQLSALRWKANRTAHWRKADNEGPSATQQLISFWLSAIKLAFLDARGVNQKEIVLNLPQMIHSRSTLGTTHLTWVITSIIDILYSMMVQVCEGLRFDLPFFLPDVQNM